MEYPVMHHAWLFAIKQLLCPYIFNFNPFDFANISGEIVDVAFIAKWRLALPVFE